MKGFRCKECKRVIALTDGKYLYAGGIAITFRGTFACLHCGRPNSWRPVIESNGRGNVIVESPLSLEALAMVLVGE